jgi:hypothetical protein
MFQRSDYITRAICQELVDNMDARIESVIPVKVGHDAFVLKARKEAAAAPQASIREGNSHAALITTKENRRIFASRQIEYNGTA